MAGGGLEGGAGTRKWLPGMASVEWSIVTSTPCRGRLPHG